jgi:hypothetical protein
VQKKEQYYLQFDLRSGQVTTHSISILSTPTADNDNQKKTDVVNNEMEIPTIYVSLTISIEKNSTSY